jgi:hypothetical protein
MIQPLIVNFNEVSLLQIQQEAGASALVTPSYVQGLRWIADSNLPISGIYLNPTDSSYSALRFMAIAIAERPATPIFILDESGDLTPQNFTCLADKFKIQGSFQGKKHFAELLQPLQVNVPPALLRLKTRQVTKSTCPGYVAIPVIDFIHSKNYPFNVFVEDENQALRFFAMEGSEVDLDYLIYLSQNTSWLYVEESSIQSRKVSSNLIETSYLDPDYLSPSWRSAETLFRAKSILSQLKKGGISDELAEKTYSIVEDVVQHVSQLGQQSQLKNFVAQAKQCDRTVACATYSILLCKKLKYERAAIVESLGVASFFQDVALYHSPFGDISDRPSADMTEAEVGFYLNHPTFSADLIGKVKTVPEVTLQVIRQHHERTDRTGFPMRIGGVQLQPLAEILSLINAYLDHESSKEPEADYLTHYSPALVQPFLQILKAMSLAQN